MTDFLNIDELLTTLNREKVLLSEMFGKRKSVNLSFDDALHLVDEDNHRLEYLIHKGVIRDTDDSIELEESFLSFFEQILAVNEEINAAYIDESIQKIREHINYYLNENHAGRKQKYLDVVKKTFRQIGKITLRKVIDLRRIVEYVFKNEANYKNKQLKLQNLDERRKVLKILIDQTLHLTDNEERVFFNQALDTDLRQIITFLKFQLHECSHNLIEIEKQIIDYLNQVDLQGKFVEKLRRIEQLRAQYRLEAETDIREVLAKRKEVIFEKRWQENFPLSLDYLREDEEAFESVKRIAERHVHRKKVVPEIAGEMAEEVLQTEVEEEIFVDLEAIKNQFYATNQDLFSFVNRYTFPKDTSFEDRVNFFCQIAAQFEQEFDIEDEYATEQNVEYALVYPK